MPSAQPACSAEVSRRQPLVRHSECPATENNRLFKGFMAAVDRMAAWGEPGGIGRPNFFRVAAELLRVDRDKCKRARAMLQAHRAACPYCAYG